MLKFSDVVKTFISKLYILLMILLIVLVGTLVKDSVENRPSLLVDGVYVSQSELCVSSNEIISTEELTSYLNIIAYRAKNDAFLQEVVDYIELLLENNTIYTPQEVAILTNITKDNVAKGLSVVAIPDNAVLQINFTNGNARLAQMLNEIVLVKISDILKTGDPNDVLGGVRDGSMKYSTGKKPNLPTSPKYTPTVNNEQIGWGKLVLISIIAYILIVIAYDFVMGYINSRLKAKCMVNTEIIADITIPYIKNQNGKED